MEVAETAIKNANPDKDGTYIEKFLAEVSNDLEPGSFFSSTNAKQTLLASMYELLIAGN